jgi:hypothetical protein
MAFDEEGSSSPVLKQKRDMTGDSLLELKLFQTKNKSFPVSAYLFSF